MLRREMCLSVLILLTVSGYAVCSSCVDGVDNVIRVYDTSDGGGKILVKDVEIGTYGKDKMPTCVDGKPQVMFPGYFKLLKGTVEILDGVKGKQPLQLSVTLEKKLVLRRSSL
ncbi:hypothetical protein KIN20_025517 [Parelaphostrongylus tenuis]|uniref:Uncharacterized protein n=1 Tax=Parelaphostrongylus tenuis TaxID=148309 RepID=A0AAD5NAU0_PARTN|nr:hypothetical protein KIN20_025517 [Parelaphostrongylus tenuis]